LKSVVIAFLVFAAVFNPWTIENLPQDGLVSVLLSPQTFFFVSFLIIVRLDRIPLDDLGVSFSCWKRDVQLGLLLGISPVLLVLLVGSIADWIHASHPFLPHPMLGGPAIDSGISAYRYALLLVWAPIAEELFFRGVFLRALNLHYSPVWAISFSAVIFMLGHGIWAPGPLLLGFITGFTAYKTRSILPCILFHTFSNAYGPLMVKYSSNLYRYLDVFYKTSL
jgi:membrane protease YdiL (CAAX protease family)